MPEAVAAMISGYQRASRLPAVGLMIWRAHLKREMRKTEKRK